VSGLNNLDSRKTGVEIKAFDGRCQFHIKSFVIQNGRCRRLGPVEGRDKLPFDSLSFYSPPCVRQYSLSGVSLSRLRISSQKTSFNEAMHNANVKYNHHS
jgi:hypothetical protein